MGLALYAYVGSDPLSYTDPLGLWALTAQIYGLYGPLGGGIVLTGSGFSVDSFSLRVGIGAGKGVSFNPKGGKPAANAPCGSNSLGFYAEAEIGKGPFSLGAGVNKGITLDQTLISVAMAAGSRSMVLVAPPVLGSLLPPVWNMRERQVLASSSLIRSTKINVTVRPPHLY